MAIRQVSFGAPAAQSPLVQALAPRDPRQMLAIQALQEGSSTAPVQSIGEGLARVAQGALGGWFAGRQKRESEESSGRLADVILSGMPEAQRNGPQGAWMRAALQDETLRGPIVAAYAQSNMAPRAEWETVSGQQYGIPGMVQRNRQDGRIQILDTPERARAMTAATQEPYVVIGETAYPREALRAMFGGAGQPATPGQAAADYPVDASTRALAQLRPGESGNNPNAISRDRNGNPIAYGLYQFTPATWGDAIAADPALARYTPADIMNPEAQQVVAESHARNILRRLNPYIGQTFNGQTITPEMLIRGAWIGGPGGMERYLQTNGQYNPGDVYGTRIGDYFNGTARNLQPLPGRSAGTQVAQAPAQTATDAAPARPAIPTPQGTPGAPSGPRVTTVNGMPALVSPRSPQATVNIDQRAGQAMVEIDRDRLKALQELSGNDRRMLTLFDRMERAIQAVPEGLGAQYLPAFGQAARALGLEIGGTSEAEVVAAIQSTLTGLARPPGSGATSDFEQRLYMQAVPRLGNTREGNLALIDMGRRLARRRLQETQLARTIMRRDGNLDRLDDEIEALGPVFNERDVQVLGGGAPQAPGQPGQPSQPAQPQMAPRRARRPETGEEVEWNGSAWVPVRPQ